MQWSCWTIVGLLQIYTNRYLAHLWKWKSLLHNIAGFLASFMCIFSTYMATKENGFTLFSGRHGSIGLVLGILTLFLAISGILPAYLLRFKTNTWGKMKFIKSKLPHKYLGLSMIIASQLAITSGIKVYHKKA